jgi:hypothetical protein
VINFELAAPNAPVSYPITFTEFLKDGILANTKLKLLKSGEPDCHLIFSGEVTDYLIQPVSIQGDNVAAQNRLTIGLRIEIENTLDPDKSLEFRPRSDLPITIRIRISMRLNRNFWPKSTSNCCKTFSINFNPIGNEFNIDCTRHSQAGFRRGIGLG